MPRKVVADNRRARFDYDIGEVFEAGIALTGTEVKSLRNGKATVGESYAAAKAGEMWLYNAYIPEYLEANRFNHETRRPRKLLLHKRQISKLAHAVEREGMTVVPLKIYFNEQGRAQGGGRPRQGPQDPRQARGREGARLVARQGPPDARPGLIPGAPVLPRASGD